MTVQPLAIIKEPALLESISSYWVVQKVKSFSHFLGLSYKGSKDELMALFTAIDLTLVGGKS